MSQRGRVGYGYSGKSATVGRLYDRVLRGYELGFFCVGRASRIGLLIGCEVGELFGLVCEFYGGGRHAGIMSIVVFLS